MKLLSASIAILTLLLFFIGCADVTPPQENPPSFKSILSDLPDINLKLPKSLEGDEASGSKGIGDVSLLNSGNVNAVKSQAWAQLKQQNPFTKMIQFGLNLIKQYAKSNDIPVDTPFSYTLTDKDNDDFWGGIMRAPSYPPSLLTKADIIITGVENDFTLHVKIKVAWDENDFNGVVAHGNIDVYNKLHITSEGEDINLKLITDVSGETSYDSNPGTMAVGFYTFIDSETGCGDVYFSQNFDGNEYGGLMSTKYLSDGSMAIFSKYSSYSDNISIAWGNDEIGGSVYAYSSWYNAEYYSNGGNLAYSSYGDDTPGYYYTDDKVNITGLAGIPASPETIYMRYNGSNYEITTDISGTPSWTTLSNFGVWTDLNNDGYMDSGEYYYGFYSKAGVDWTQGDIIYGFDSSLDSAEWGYLQVFKTELIVPEATTIFGNNYYLRHQYPLNQLLPLAAPYDTSFQLAQEETGSFTDTWTDFEGNSQSYTYYYYDYYLDALGDGDDTPETMTFNPGVDIAIHNLNQNDVYIWNGSDYDKDKAYFYYCENLPPYFNHPDAIGDQVNARIQEVYTNYVENLDLAIYAAMIDSINPNDQYFSRLK